MLILNNSSIMMVHGAVKESGLAKIFVAMIKLLLWQQISTSLNLSIEIFYQFFYQDEIL